MQVYQVGGAVRDRLLNRPVRERDYVVVGATPEQMLALGYRQVGRDFPVFLHPQSGEEYALARTLRRSASLPGTVIADPDVTLEEDLSRRDFTINAMAEDDQGGLIDPYGGRRDLQERRLRHVSDAFREDPLRVLRAARFLARYAELGFHLAPETESLIRVMVSEGELDKLVPERVWQELLKVLKEPHPGPFFEALRHWGALARVLPEIDALWGVPQPARWHPEVDCGVHTLMTLEAACRLSELTLVRFAALTHDLGKATTPQRILPSHHGHEKRGAEIVTRMCHRLKAPAAYERVARQCARYHILMHRFYELRPKTLLELMQGLDAFRKPDHMQWFVWVCQADHQGRLGMADSPYPQGDDLLRLFTQVRAVGNRQVSPSLSGRLLGDAIQRARKRRIAEILEVLQAERTG
ncbi:MAG: multifunctional CCA addition/repair protein [Candidatus Thiodiazotropha sp.]